ncbi:MAG: hypothetical protein KDB90_15980 [Planctomycetes bacterium]|nr:hypothetical protein [Planctomycetota bacterium]
MEWVELLIYGIAFVLNVLFGWLGARWVARKGYPEWRTAVWMSSIFLGFVVPLIIISAIPGRARPVPRRNLQRRLPNARMPLPRQRDPVEVS